MAAQKKLTEEEIQNLIAYIDRRQVMICTKCSSELKKSKQKHILGICTSKECKYRQGFNKDYLFYGLKIEKRVMLRIIEYWLVKSPIDIISYHTGVSRQTISTILRKIGLMLDKKNIEESTKIGGEGVIVEIDESKFGKRKYNRGHRVEGVWVFGMVERTSERKIKLVVVDDRSASTLNDSLAKFVKKESTIYSDRWKGYKDVIENFAEHLTVNHSENYVDPFTGAHTNTIEGNWCGIKMHIPYRLRTKAKINMYLTRYMLLRNAKEHVLIALIKTIC